MNLKKPDWLKVSYSKNENTKEVEKILSTLGLHTVCEEAACPNKSECFSRKTATFMIMGNACTRNCKFCNVTHSKPEPLCKDEPYLIQQAVKKLKLKHVVITSVTRDDLPDGGAAHFAEVIFKLRQLSAPVIIEVLIPDLSGSSEALMTVLKAGPDILNHNIETVPRLFPAIRPEGNYTRSIELLKKVKTTYPDMLTKSGIMAGLGETNNEIIRVLEELKKVKVDIITIGQYLSPSKHHYPVQEYITPETFKHLYKKAKEIGFKYVASAPFVRSSYNAEALLNDKS
jgi:lipoic acid synthetase